MKRILLLFLIAIISSPVAAATQHVVAYVALDREFSQPILDSFARETGIRVDPVFDVEASKTVALVNRILAEKERPLCDVFWNNELLQTLRLKTEGALQSYDSPNAADIPSLYQDPEHYWTGFAARARVIIYNKNIIKPEAIPVSIFEWGKGGKNAGQFALANPHFGTTSTHFAALASIYGEDQLKAAVARWKNAKVAVLAGNGPVRNDVAAGRYAYGLTDTDDALGAIMEGKPVGMLFPKEGLLIPNSVALIQHAPHAEAGRKLIDFILRPQTEKALAHSASAQIPLRDTIARPAQVPSIKKIGGIQVDWNRLLEAMLGAMESADRLLAR